MNLAPAGGQQAPGRRRRSRTPGQASGWARFGGVVVLAGSLAVAFLDLRSLSARLESAEAESAQFREQIGERDRAAERLRADREELEVLASAEKRLARWDEERFLLPELLRGMSHGVADEVVFEELRREGPRIWITARTTSADAVADAARSLSRLDRLNGVELLWAERVEGAPEGVGQRFSLAGGLRYNSREPGPFSLVEAADSDGGGGD